MIKKTQSVKREKLSLFFLFTGLIVAIFAPNFADPFNVPKQIVLFIFASYLLFDLVISRNYIFKLLGIKLSAILLLFIFGLLSSSYFTSPKYIAFYGDNLRKNGFLTYLAFVIMFLFVITKFNQENSRDLYKNLFILNLFVSGYGLLQILGLDFINWTKSAGIIGTLGNSNFAGVVYSFFGLLSLGAFFDKKKLSQFFYPIFNFLISFICLLNTNARQSLIIFIFGVVILMFNFVDKISKSVRIIFVLIFIIVTTQTIFGIFNKGPFAFFLYKDSISIRIYYWKAAIKMFIHHPMFGVGMDRYGSYFKEYRESSYSLKYGFDLTSTNAHNVFLQIFATTGIIGGAAYVCLIIYVLNSGIQLIKNSSGSNRNYFVSIFSVWSAFQLQSLVSIDNIGVAVFNWLFSGLIVGSYLKSRNPELINFNFKNKSTIGVLAKPLLVVPALLSAFIISQSEQSYLTLRNSFNPGNTQLKSSYVDLAVKTLKNPLLDPQYRTAIANSLLDFKEFDLGKKFLDQSYALDSRDLSTLWGLALFHEIQGNFNDGLRYRAEIEKIDPWNAKNYLQSLNDYLNLNDRVGAERVLRKINDFAANTEEGKQATVLFAKIYK